MKNGQHALSFKGAKALRSREWGLSIAFNLLLASSRVAAGFFTGVAVCLIHRGVAGMNMIPLGTYVSLIQARCFSITIETKFAPTSFVPFHFLQVFDVFPFGKYSLLYTWLFIKVPGCHLILIITWANMQTGGNKKSSLRVIVETGTITNRVIVVRSLIWASAWSSVTQSALEF